MTKIKKVQCISTLLIDFEKVFIGFLQSILKHIHDKLQSYKKVLQYKINYYNLNFLAVWYGLEYIAPVIAFVILKTNS